LHEFISSNWSIHTNSNFFLLPVRSLLVNRFWNEIKLAHPKVTGSWSIFYQMNWSTWGKEFINTFRGVGTGAASTPPPKFSKVPFFREQSALFVRENVIKITFFAQRALLKTWIYVISGNFFKFSGKISYIRKFFLVYPENFFHI
jgi:hypothetical protein